MSVWSAAEGAVARALGDVWAELREVAAPGARGRQGLMVAASVPLATVLALALRLEFVWWAGITAFMTTMATSTATVRRVALRLAGTAAGAGAAFVMARWLPYDIVALTLFLGAATMLGVVGMLVSPHGMAWMLAGVTANMVLLMALEDPLAVPFDAFYRLAEVAVGAAAALVVVFVVRPEAEEAPLPVAPGWRGLLGPQWPLLLHGVRAAVAAVVVVHVWMLFALPSATQMAITVMAVMVAPQVGVDAVDGRRAVAERALHRLLGCLLGGAVALLCLALSVESFVVWLGLVAGGVWLCMHVQNSSRGVGYVGTQAGVVFIVTLIQGAAPPTSIMPGIERFLGISMGLGVLLAVSLVIWPGRGEAGTG